MKPHDLGTLFDTLAEQRSDTVVQLSRPLDISLLPDVSYDVGQLAGLVQETAAWLTEAGARPGDTVAVVKPNHWDYALLACAATRLGAIPALLSDHLAPHALQTLLTRLNAAVLVTDARILQAARRTTSDLTAFAGRTVSLEGTAPGATPLDELRGGVAPPPRRPATDRTLLITHTSGTTGVPKLVEHTATTIIQHLAGFEARRIPVITSRRNDTVANANPFCHGRTIPWTVSVFQLRPHKVVILDDSAPATAHRTLAQHPPTLLEAAPATYTRWRELAEHPRATDNVFRDVRLYISTFDAMHPPTVRTFLAASRRRLPLWIQAWGQTETGPLTFRPLTRRAVAQAGGRHPTTRNVGRPVPRRTRIKVVDPETLRPVGRGRPGLVMVRTRALCAGYAGERERWAAKADGRWWNTGDLGVLTRSGCLRLLDREVDTVPGISCMELEDVLEDRLPLVREATVLSVKGQPPQPVLVVSGGQLDASAWRQATTDLPALADPVVLPWQDVPRTGTGKVRRQLLRERLFPGAGLEGYGTGRWT